MNTVRWGIIGAGDVCERKSGPPLARVEASALCLVHRRNREAGEDFCRRHGGRYVGSLAELVESDEIDAVYVASPHALHAEHSIAALRAGKHVLVEKPMALSVADCDRMVAEASAAGRSLGVAYYRRGYPSVRRLKAVVAEGELGRIRRLSVNAEFPTSHRLDLVHYLLGVVRRVRATRERGEGYRFERMGGRIFLEAGADATEVCLADRWTETGTPEAIAVEGTDGSALLADLKGGLLVLRGGGGRANHLESTGGLPYTHWGLVENFVAHLISGEPLLCDGVEGRRSTAVLEAIDRAPDETWVEPD